MFGEVAAAGAGCTAGEFIDPLGGCAPGAAVGVGLDEVANAAEGLISLFAADNNDETSQSAADTDAQAEPIGCNPLARDPFQTGTSGGPKSSPNFLEPTNPPQDPPADVPPGHSVRVMAPTSDYPNGFWVETNQNGQPIDPSTGRPPSNVTRPQARAMTHVPLPPR